MIITDEALLRVKCDQVLPDEVNDLKKKLEQALIWSANNGRPGVGLACPQIGIAKSMAIVRVDDSIKIDLVNAKIVQMYHPFIFENEGCLSFPDRWVRTQRYKEVVVEGNIISPNRFIVTDFSAVVVIHEINHLSGILLPDFAIKN
jgi:peptide deformylase